MENENQFCFKCASKISQTCLSFLLYHTLRDKTMIWSYILTEYCFIQLLFNVLFQYLLYMSPNNQENNTDLFNYKTNFVEHCYSYYMYLIMGNLCFDHKMLINYKTMKVQFVELGGGMEVFDLENTCS